MQALVLNDDCETQTKMTIALLKRGFHVINAESISAAMAYVGLGAIDLVLIKESIGGKLSHSVALSAEHNNPQVATLLMTPRIDPDVDELYDLLPSLYCLLGTEISADLVAQLATSAIAGKARAVQPRHQKKLVLDLPDAEMSMTFRSQQSIAPPYGMDADVSLQGHFSHTGFEQSFDRQTSDSWTFDAALKNLEKTQLLGVAAAA